MSVFSDAVVRQVFTKPQNCAAASSDGSSLSYHQLLAQALVLAKHLDRLSPDATKPVMIKGHKEPVLLAAQFACIISGRAYVPLDASTPPARMQAIAQQLPGSVCLDVEDGLAALACKDAVLDTDELKAAYEAFVTNHTPITGDDAQYILFTSGTTGVPKGVIQRAESIDMLMDYFARFIPQTTDESALRFFNRVPFSFDVSLFDLVMALPHGHTLCFLDAQAQTSLSASFAALRHLDPNVWVSTPSFAELCLADASFNQNLMPNLKHFIFCGEVLQKPCVQELFERFKGVRIFNTYGPTETQAMTDIEITSVLLEKPEPLPIGFVAPYCFVFIKDVQTEGFCKPNQAGEIYISGPSLAAGYLGLPEKTAEAFLQCEAPDGKLVRAYKTGDLGYADEQGCLHFLGRIDSQIKIHGFRVELTEIESVLMSHEAVSQVCVVPLVRRGKITGLKAWVVANSDLDDKDLSRVLKSYAKERLPEYMRPRAMSYLSVLPQTSNGKIDRKKLTGEGV